MIDINITQAFCSNLEEMYCEIIRNVYNKKNVRIKINNEDGKIYCSNSSKSNVSFLDNTLNATEINSKISEIQKNDLINYMANMLYKCKDLADDTVASLFVSCCNFGYLWDIFLHNKPKKIIEALCSSIGDEKLKEYLSILGIGILTRGYDSKSSTDMIKKAIEIYPENEMSKIYDFTIKCVTYDWYLTDIMQDYLSNENEFQDFLSTVNEYICDLSISLNKIDQNMHEILLQESNENEFQDFLSAVNKHICDLSISLNKIDNNNNEFQDFLSTVNEHIRVLSNSLNKIDRNRDFCKSNYCIYLPHIICKHIPNGLIESQTAYRNPVYFINPSARKTIMESIMPTHLNYLSDNFSICDYDFRKQFSFLGIPLVVDIFGTKDYFRLYGNLLNQNTELDEKNHKLSALQQEKKDLIDYHRHNWKHIVYPSIVESVAQELLAAGDEDKANKLFSAYNSEMLLKNDLKLLALEYENNPSEQITLMKDSMLLQSARGSKAKTISSIFCNALDNVVFRIVMEKVDTSNEIVDVQNYLAAKQYDMTSIRESYIENFMGNNCKPKDGQEILTWFSENFFRVRLMFEDNADSWGKLKFKAGDTSWTKFAEIFINLINNALKYGKDYLDVTFGKCGRNGSEFFTITMTNPIDPAPGDQEGEHKGLTYIDKFFRSINTAACNEELGIEIGKENNVFGVTIFITDKVF